MEAVVWMILLGGIKKNREAYMKSDMRRLFSGGSVFSEASGVVGAFGDPWAE